MGDNERYTAMNLYTGVLYELMRGGIDVKQATEQASAAVDAFNKQFDIK